MLFETKDDAARWERQFVKSFMACLVLLSLVALVSMCGAAIMWLG